MTKEILISTKFCRKRHRVGGGGKILDWCFFSGVRVVGFGGKVVTLGVMKEYRKKQQRTDPVQRLAPGQEYFDCILDPKGEQARRNEEMRREQELANAKMEYLEQLAEFDESRLPRHPAEKEQEKGVGTVVFAVVALVALVIAMLLFG